MNAICSAVVCASGFKRLSRSSWSLLKGVCFFGMGGVTPCVLGASDAQIIAQNVEFDTDVMSSRGVDSALAEYFRYEPRFREGERVVTLVVNGNRRGLVRARFDRNGVLCFSPALLDKAGLRRMAAQNDGAQTCHAFLARYPQTRVTLRPNQEEVFLVVPTQALDDIAPPDTVFSDAGTAGMFSYDLLGGENRVPGSSTRHLSASTLAGFNAGNWVVRSRQQWVFESKVNRFEHLYAFAQHDFQRLDSTFQLGQINTAGPMFSGLPITGAQLFPSNRRGIQDLDGTRVEGVATSQSRIEIRQSGALIHTTIVPAGPFSVSGFSLLNASNDLQVRVIDESGSSREFSVSSASFHHITQAPAGYYLAMGKVRSVSNYNVEPQSVATAGGSWGLGREVMFSAGLMGAEGYHAAGWGLDTRLFEHFDVRWRTIVARQAVTDDSGVQQSISVSSAFFQRASASLSATLRSKAYSDLLDDQRDSDDLSRQRFANQYTATLGWVDPQWGGLSVGYSRSALSNGLSNQRVYGSWGKSFGYAGVSLSVEKNVGSTHKDQNALSAYLSVSVALGRSRQLRSYASHRNKTLALGTSLGEQVSDSLSYRLGVEGGNGGRTTRFNADIGLLPRYTQLNLGVSHDDSSTYSIGQLRGGAVLHGGGITLSPYPIQETFGIASVGELSGVKISTPLGPAWTDPKGQAVIASLPAYSPGRVEVVTRTLPRQIDIQNGFKQVQAGRGSFNTIDFEVVQVRRLLLQILDEQGLPISRGASVLTKNGKFLGSVVEAGKVFLSDIQGEETLMVKMADLRECELQLAVSPLPDGESLYETAQRVCHVR